MADPHRGPCGGPEMAAARFSALLDQLSQREDLAVIVVNGPSEPGLQTSHPWQIVLPPATLEELFTLTVAVDKVLCHDTMMAHLAAALGKTVHTIFGPQNPDWFAPFRNQQRVIIHDVCPHRPCFDHCLFPSPLCIEAINIEEVVEAVIKKP
jgi:ADP-heptose:LPS heptosyltransferase